MTLVIEGDFDSGFVLREVSDRAEAVFQQFEPEGDLYALTLHTTASEMVGGAERKFPFRVRLVLVPDYGLDTVLVFSYTMRRGVLRLGDREVAFALLGLFGTYDEGADTVFFDLNADGLLDTGPHSYERTVASDQLVGIAGQAYEFVVERYGERLSVRPTDTPVPVIIHLGPGDLAPDFSFADLDGVEHALGDFRGQVVLIDFWGVWCGPCVKEVPHLVESYERFHANGFEILGIDYQDSEERLSAFLSESAITWPQARETRESRPIHDAYGVQSWPSTFLVDEEGRILAFDLRGEALATVLENHFGEDR